jgi:hypothetical protein
MSAGIGAVVASRAGDYIERAGEEDFYKLAEQALERGITLEDVDKEEFNKLYREIFNKPITEDFYNSLKNNTEAFYEL